MSVNEGIIVFGSVLSLFGIAVIVYVKACERLEKNINKVN